MLKKMGNRSQRERRPCFAVDIDNVLARAEREVQRLFFDITGTLWPRGKYGSAGGLDSDQLPQEVIEQIFERFHEQSIPRLPLLPGARMALSRLKKRYRISIITARRPTSRAQTLVWLKAHHIPFDELYHTEDKTQVPENIALAVDDHPLHALAYGEMGVRTFLMAQPWNQGVTHALLTRVTGWDDLLQRLDYGNVDPALNPLLESPPVKSLLQTPESPLPFPVVEAS